MAWPVPSDGTAATYVVFTCLSQIPRSGCLLIPIGSGPGQHKVHTAPVARSLVPYMTLEGSCAAVWACERTGGLEDFKDIIIEFRVTCYCDIGNPLTLIINYRQHVTFSRS